MAFATRSILAEGRRPASRPAHSREDDDHYAVVRQVIEFLTESWREQPSMETIAAKVGMEPTGLQKTFTQWAGLSPQAFLQAVTLGHARRLLVQSATAHDTADEVGPERLHDLFVTHEAVAPGTFNARGEGLAIRFGYHRSPFGNALVMATERGLAGLAFGDKGEEAAVLADMTRRWPRALYIEDVQATAPLARRIFDPKSWRPETPLRVVLIGSAFDVCIWETLLMVPFGRATTYTELARQIQRPSAARAVGGAVGRNPISFVVPCHRVLGRSGSLTGYYWGLTRKRAMLGWEAGISAGLG